MRACSFLLVCCHSQQLPTGLCDPRCCTVLALPHADIQQLSSYHEDRTLLALLIFMEEFKMSFGHSVGYQFAWHPYRRPVGQNFRIRLPTETSTDSCIISLVVWRWTCFLQLYKWFSRTHPRSSCLKFLPSALKQISSTMRRLFDSSLNLLVSKNVNCFTNVHPTTGDYLSVGTMQTRIPYYRSCFQVRHLKL
jgi:hypothetical protein